MSRMLWILHEMNHVHFTRSVQWISNAMHCQWIFFSAMASRSKPLILKFNICTNFWSYSASMCTCIWNERFLYIFTYLSLFLLLNTGKSSKCEFHVWISESAKQWLCILHAIKMCRWFFDTLKWAEWLEHGIVATAFKFIARFPFHWHSTHSFPRSSSSRHATHQITVNSLIIV